MRIQDKRLLQGMDQDAANEFIKEVFYRSATNVVINDNESGSEGVMSNIKGNRNDVFEEISSSYGTDGVDNECIGSLSVPELNTIFVFNKSNDGNDSIYRVTFTGGAFEYQVRGVVYNITGSSQRYIYTKNGLELTSNDSPLNFQDGKLTSIEYVEGFLCWTDGYNEPRSIQVYRDGQFLQYDDPDFDDIAGIKRPSLQEPIVTRTLTSYTGSYDDVVENNTNFRGRSYQFAYKYRYADGSESVWSSSSKLIGTAVSKDLGSYVSKLTININNPYLYDSTGSVPQDWFDRIDKVIVAYKNTADGNWNEFKEVEFDNNGTGLLPVIDFTDENGVTVVSTDQVLKPFDNVPVFAQAMVVSKDRKIYGNITEGYDVSEPVISKWGSGLLVTDGVYYGSLTRSVVKNRERAFAYDSKYKTGIIWKDSYGRKSGVVGIQDWWTTHRGVGFFNIDGNYSGAGQQSRPTLQIELDASTQIPEWAESFDVVVTNNLSMVSFLEAVTTESVHRRKRADDTIEKVTESGKVIGITETSKQLIYSDGKNQDGQWIVDNNGAAVSSKPQQLALAESGSTSNISCSLNGSSSNVKITNRIGRSFNGEIIYLGGYVGSPAFPCGTGVKNKGERPATDFAEEVTLNIGNLRYNKIGYIFTEGDRVRIYGYYDINGTKGIKRYTDADSGNSINYIDLEITSQEGDNLICRWDNQYKTPVFDINLIKIYTPREEQSEDIFYDIGYSYQVENPKTPQRKLPSTGNLQIQLVEGDCWVIDREFKSLPDSNVPYTVNASVFAMNADDRYFQEWDTGYNRPNIKLETPVRKKLTSKMVYGGKIIEDSNINNLDSFDLLGNTKDLPNEYGAIRSMNMVDNVLVVLCENEAVSIYVEERALRDVLGQDTLALTDQVLNNDRKMAGGYGCSHPESVWQYKSFLYWYSQNKQSVIRYNVGNGAFPISKYGMKSYFMNKANTLKASSQSVVGGYNPKYDMYYLTFGDETVCFHEGENPAWIGFVDFLPESYGYIIDRMVTFKDGKPWEHDTSDTYNEFYGRRYTSNLTVVGQIEPSMRKVANNLMLETDSDNWSVTAMSTDNQTTKMDSFENINGERWTDVLCDENSIGGLFEGDLLEGNTFEVTLSNNSLNRFRLFAVNIFSQLNNRTNK